MATKPNSDWIREKIERAIGPIGAVHPEFFIMDATWPAIQRLDNTTGGNASCHYPHLQVFLVNHAGELLEFGTMGCN